MSPADDYILDIGSLDGKPGGPADSEPAAPSAATTTPSLRNRPWLAVYWKCCHAYSRIYRSRGGDVYAGRCPSCGKAARARVGPGGIDSRFFVAH